MVPVPEVGPCKRVEEQVHLQIPQKATETRSKREPGDLFSKGLTVKFGKEQRKIFSLGSEEYPIEKFVVLSKKKEK